MIITRKDMRNYVVCDVFNLVILILELLVYVGCQKINCMGKKLLNAYIVGNLEIKYLDAKVVRRDTRHGCFCEWNELYLI
jgi:hypothetical protein